MHRTTSFSTCRVYRYTLERVWDSALPRLLWILLNSSDADAFQDDPTNRRGINFSKAWGYGSCVFANLFAFQSPYPKIMMAQTEPVGPLNDRETVHFPSAQSEFIANQAVPLFRLLAQLDPATESTLDVLEENRRRYMSYPQRPR